MIYVIERKRKRKGAKWLPSYAGIQSGGGVYTKREANRDVNLLRLEAPAYEWRFTEYKRVKP